jgi:hypothetical protein
MMNCLKPLGVAFVVTGLAMPALAQSADEQIAAARAASEKYKDVNVALADGFVPDPSGLCISAAEEGLPAEWGSMGIHYLNMALLKMDGSGKRVDGAGTNTDFATPAILLYEPQQDGSLELVGLENLVFLKAWEAEGNNNPPSFAGKNWDVMADDPATAGDEAHGFMPHADLHVWAIRENPAGPMVPFNANVTCEFFQKAG